MRDVVVDEIIYIDEESYQQTKKEMCKSDDYFSGNEVEKLSKKLSNWM